MRRLAAFFFLCLFCGCAPSFALTLAQIRTEIRRNVHDTDSTRQRYSDSVLLDYVNEAQKEVVNVTLLTQKTTSYVLLPLTTYYALPTDFLSSNHVDFKNNSGLTMPMDQVTIKGLANKNPDWKKVNGIPAQYLVDNSTSDTTQTVSYIPVPTNASTGTVTMRYSYQVPDMANDGDVPFNGKRQFYTFHMAIVYHVTLKLKIREGKFDEASSYGALYTNYLGEIQKFIGSIPDYKPSLVIGGK